jgi:hypothetical protein
MKHSPAVTAAAEEVIALIHPTNNLLTEVNSGKGNEVFAGGIVTALA